MKLRWRGFPLPPMVLLSLLLLRPQAASAQDTWTEAPMTLRRTPQLAETIAPAERGMRPSLVDGDRLSERPDLEVVVEGNASLRRGDTRITADRLEYQPPGDLATASGNVHLNQAGNVYEGPELHLKVESFEGFFDHVRYTLLANGAHGEAERIDFVDPKVSVARHATYTTCLRENYTGWMPAWMLTAVTLTTDSETNLATATDAQISFLGVTTPSLPSVSFPLNNARQSGLLPPVIGYDTTNGFEYLQPWYWNIAANRDLTLYPEIMTSRGVNLGTEFRYLEKTYSGQIRVDEMPSDSLRGINRWGLWAKHNQQFDPKPFGLDSLSTSFNINRVSDDDYWRDFSHTPTLTSRTLTNEADLNWSKGDWSGQARTLSYQTLQYAASPITPSYNRVPQITANYNKYDWHGLDVSGTLDYTRFEVDSAYSPTLNGIKQPNGERVVGNLQISRPWVTPGGYIIPKLLLHTAAYQLDSPLASGATSISSVVPTVSLDSGLVFERDASLFGRAWRQTLEPRAFYVHTPYRDQSQLPVYDTATNDISFATLYTENAFSGNDRISDTNTLTTGVSTRLIDPATGAESARFGIAQRFRFSDQNVTLPSGTAVTDRTGDFIVGGLVHWSPKWSIDGVAQYNMDTGKSSRDALTLRYTPAPYHTLTAAYRYQADSSSTADDGTKTIDLNWQWPLSELTRGLFGERKPGDPGRWYAVGRLSYSLHDRAMSDSLIGAEYNACCWVGRIVLERLVSGRTTPDTRLMFQIQFNGFGNVGSNPTSTLLQNIQGYQPLNTQTQEPSRFTNYD
ncbi:LPS-assembly protein LptD [Variovorax sp. Root411]|uniref:LPS-assembly protein LptD n=1 Tax=Variovorax sp. Root411 TaxID=1736530 RepID=UPI0006F958F3|nr:LPS assembly protein LptD [Variovorax sp. Root411]KQW61854.1 LPS biosynthesis protein [Variovorax sp. Root411]